MFSHKDNKMANKDSEYTFEQLVCTYHLNNRL